MSIDELSAWIDTHQLLVVSVLIPVISAATAALASWYSTRRVLKAERGKLNFEGVMKIAEFRQEWINSLRDEMANFQSFGVLPNADPTTEREFYKLGTKIELLMNPQDPDYPELQAKMYEFLHVANGEVSDKYRVNPAYVQLCQQILKREWDRLKSDIEHAKNSL
ncbi:MAG: hypothetical protein HZB95_03720 [Nitrosomonadales bacterium]|nr:hypothetical protein [Nitrosomonadales bacterium]